MIRDLANCVHAKRTAESNVLRIQHLGNYQDLCIQNYCEQEKGQRPAFITTTFRVLSNLAFMVIQDLTRSNVTFQTQTKRIYHHHRKTLKNAGVISDGINVIVQKPIEI